jgi:peptidyl-prolyl cis-trans isomerase C
MYTSFTRTGTAPKSRVTKLRSKRPTKPQFTPPTSTRTSAIKSNVLFFAIFPPRLLKWISKISNEYCLINISTKIHSLIKKLIYSAHKIEPYLTNTKQEAKMVKKVNASHILVKTEAEANVILYDLRRGADFEAMAKEKSTCSSGKKGGNLGWFGKGKMIKEFETAAFSMKKGELSNPVKSQFGWHIIKVIDAK